MKLLIRDDDVSYFTEPEELELWFKDVWDKVPIHLAVIPWVYAGQDETPLEKRDKLYHYIGNNKRLCSFLKRKVKQGKVKLWMHGYSHRTLNNKFECEYLDWMSFDYGIKAFKDVFGIKPKIFVAPHDRFSKQCIKSIEKHKMNICRGFVPRLREFRLRWKYLDAFWILGRLWFFYQTKYRWPSWIDYGKHKELYSYRLGEIKDIDSILEWHKKGILCITIHHRHMNQEALEKLKYITRNLKK